jgi:hypothetical protein
MDWPAVPRITTGSRQRREITRTDRTLPMPIADGASTGQPLDLVQLAAGSHALTPLIHLPLKCAACGSTMFTIAIEYAGAYKPIAPP